MLIFKNKNKKVTHAVTELDCYQVSALPVVDGNGRLVGNFSVTDLIVNKKKMFFFEFFYFQNFKI